MKELRFFDEVHDLQRFVRENIRLIGNYTIISEQLYLRNNETGILDMLAIDNNDKRLTIIELKNWMTTDKNAWQPLRYYDLMRRGEDGLRRLLTDASFKFQHPVEEINVIPKLVLVVPECNNQLLRTLSYFEDIDSQVVELKRYMNNSFIEIKKSVHYPSSIFHKEDLVEVQNKVSDDWNFDTYMKYGISRSKVELAQKVVNQVEGLFKQKGFKFDIFFSNTSVTIMKNNKVWGTLFIKQKPTHHHLTFSFKVHKDVKINKVDFQYTYGVESLSEQKNSIKLTLSSLLPNTLIEKYL